MEGFNMSKKEVLPEVIVFAGPNGSGKSTITRLAKTIGKYINADDIKRTNLCTDLEAAQQAESLREQSVRDRADFTFETVLSTERNLNLLKRAKEKGFFVRCIYVLTVNPDINVARVQSREADGGHGGFYRMCKNQRINNN
jgi:predicted ABC-type ATPase